MLILALLAMFGLIAVAFVVLTGHAQRGAKSIERLGLTDSLTDSTASKNVLQQAAMQIFRGSNNTASVMGAHSLLEDIYGNNWYVCRIKNAPTAVCGGQLIEFEYEVSSNGSWNPPAWNTDAAQQQRLGCVVSIYDGSAAGVSTHIVGYNPSPNWNPTTNDATPPLTVCNIGVAKLQMTAVEGLNVAALTAGTKFIINGPAFSGTGFGYNATTGQLNDTATCDATTHVWSVESVTGAAGTFPVALIPNLPSSVYTTTNGNPPGGANSDYTAADFQHMLLAAQVPNAGVIQTLPSLHRPALVNYWMKNTAVGGPYANFADLWNSSTTNKDLCRKILMRPVGVMANLATTDNPDHPNFTGSNPNFDPINNATWDVDNDGDGVPDSIWVDLGLPVRATSDGRLYKPLFAILCTDLDGRLNVNAHGCLAQASASTIANELTSLSATYGDHAFAGSGTPATLPRGFGYGPAEINLSAIFTNHQTVMNGRYPATTVAAPWIGGNAGHYLGLNNWFRYGLGNYGNFSAANNAGVYGTAPDVAGNGAIGLDWGGRPLYCFMGQNLSDTTTTNQCPCDSNLSSQQVRGSSDTPGNVLFGTSELERVLRPYDRDATSLPGRLAGIPVTATAPMTATQLQHIGITTDSWDMPSPMGAISTDLPGVAVANLPANGVTGVLKALLMSKGMTAAQADTFMPTLFAPELLSGRKMDLNRAFGNCVDDDASTATGYGVVDQPEPAESETISSYKSTGTATPAGAISYDPSGTLANNSLRARQLYARHLYVLAMLLVDKNDLKNSQQLIAVAGPTPTDDDAARFLAQWAVNMVDFYDRDSIMTPFVFNLNPFTSAGWDETIYHLGPVINADITANRVVWGCERPELLISETLAFHDRRTEDLGTDSSGPGGDHDTQSTTNHDASFDQRYCPQGSLFVELYNPWSDLEPRPYELSKATDTGVDLAKRTPASAGTVNPVWRLAIVNQVDATTDPDVVTSPPLQLERTVYFTDSTATLPSDAAHATFRPNDTMAGKIAPILPGRYAVIGPGEPTDTVSSTTFLGFKLNEHPGSAGLPDGTRRIVLTPASNANTVGQVVVSNNGTDDDFDLGSPSLKTKIKNPAAVVIGLPHRLSISEPNGGYTASVYPTPRDVPSDKSTSAVPPGESDVPTQITTAIWTDGRTDGVAVVHLQRLANPLQPYNADSNPYRTVDSMPIDLAAFNGIDPAERTKPGRTDPVILDKTPIDFWARERGANITGNNLWTQEPLTGNSPKANSVITFPTVSGFNLNAVLNHSLSYLNSRFGAPNTTTGAVGDPSATAFPWLNWNNRPFVSQLELLLVPWAKSSRLCYNYSITSTGNPYTDAASPFGRLLSFFQSPDPSVPGEVGAQLHRVLEFVGVPSRFVGTDIQIDPSVAAAGTHLFHPPFNRIPTYREPGKINLNTIYTPEVFNGLMNGHVNLNWAAFVTSRRGPAAAGDVLTPPGATYPTEFARPFRSFGGGYLVPTLTPEVLKPNREINATLLRADAAGTAPLFDFTSISDYNNTTRNPFFRYGGLQRLGNLVTTRSNVYAVWITVGYFEVEAPPSPAPAGAVYPDGYALGRELGSDTGEIDRHRAFYIFDRTLPVGFQRGQDLNVDKAILVNRFIE